MISTVTAAVAPASPLAQAAPPPPPDAAGWTRRSSVRLWRRRCTPRRRTRPRRQEEEERSVAWAADPPGSVRAAPGRLPTIRSSRLDPVLALSCRRDTGTRNRPPGGARPATSRWLAWHEAVSHGLIGREVRDLGDAVMLYDPNDREPFWNRVAGIAWPEEPAAFDRRLLEVIALFAVARPDAARLAAARLRRAARPGRAACSRPASRTGGGMLMAHDPARGTVPPPSTALDRT